MWLLEEISARGPRDSETWEVCFLEASVCCPALGQSLGLREDRWPLVPERGLGLPQPALPRPRARVHARMHVPVGAGTWPPSGTLTVLLLNTRRGRQQPQHEGAVPKDAR